MGFKITLVIFCFIFGLLVATSNGFFINTPLIKDILPINLFLKFINDFKLINNYLHTLPRIELWKLGLGFIKEKPWIGWGQVVFTTI